MKKLTVLILVLAFIMPLSGCSRTARYAKRFPGWEQVRIEKEVPQKNCEYKFQQSCSQAGGKCYDFFKQRATLKGANVVVITDLARGQRSSGSAGMYNGVGGASYSSVDSMTALADYYYCPGYKFGGQNEKTN